MSLCESYCSGKASFGTCFSKAATLAHGRVGPRASQLKRVLGLRLHSRPCCLLTLACNAGVEALLAISDYQRRRVRPCLVCVH